MFFIMVLWKQTWQYFESLSYPQKEEMTKRQDNECWWFLFRNMAVSSPLSLLNPGDLSRFLRPCAGPQRRTEWSRQCPGRPSVFWDQPAALSHHWRWQPTAVPSMLHLQPKPEIQLRPWISPFSTQHSAVYDVRKPCVIFISYSFFQELHLQTTMKHVWNSANMPIKCNWDTWTISGKNRCIFWVGMLFPAFLSQEEMVTRYRPPPQGLHDWLFLVKCPDTEVFCVCK